MFVDTHCHMNMMVAKQVDEPLEEHHLEVINAIVQRAAGSGVSKIMNVGTSLAETYNSIIVAKKFPSVWATAGIHPCDCTTEWKSDFAQLKKLVHHKEENKIIGIGETGLDFYHKPFDKQRQIDAFKAHIELSLEYNLGLVVHIRESAQEVLQVLDEYHKQARGVFHCFMQTPDVAQVGIKWGWLIGIDAPITYPKNQWLRDFVKTMPLEHLVLETDSPFLPPQSMRGKQNSPEYIAQWAHIIAELRGISLKELAAVTSENVKRVFGI